MIDKLTIWHHSSVRKDRNPYLWINSGALHILAQYSKTTENHKLWSKQKFLRNLSSLKLSLFEPSRIIITEVTDFASLCIKIGGWFCVTTFNVLSTFYSVFVYISYTFKMPVIHWLHSEAGSSPVFTLSKWRHILQEMTPFTTY